MFEASRKLSHQALLRNAAMVVGLVSICALAASCAPAPPPPPPPAPSLAYTPPPPPPPPPPPRMVRGERG